jgi:hypothetical protein
MGQTPNQPFTKKETAARIRKVVRSIVAPMSEPPIGYCTRCRVHINALRIARGAFYYGGRVSNEGQTRPTPMEGGSLMIAIRWADGQVRLVL